MRFSRRLRRSCDRWFVSFNCGGRGNDVENHAIRTIEITRRRVFNIGRSHFEVVVQFRIYEPRIGIVQRKLRESLRAIHRRLPAAYRIV